MFFPAEGDVSAQVPIVPVKAEIQASSSSVKKFFLIENLSPKG
jgi:hypothetical protein